MQQLRHFIFNQRMRLTLAHLFERLALIAVAAHVEPHFLEENLLNMVRLYVKDGFQQERATCGREDHFRRVLAEHLLVDESAGTRCLHTCLSRRCPSHLQ